MKIPEDFLECCIDKDTGEVRDSESITEAVLIETANVGDFVNDVVFDAVKAVVETYVVPEAEEFAKDYFDDEDPQAEALRSIYNETAERMRSEA